MRTQDTEIVKGGNLTMTYEGSELEGLKAAVNYYTWIADEFRPYLRGHCLEVGAGQGTFSEFLLHTPIEALTCVEPAVNLLPLLRAKFTDVSKPVVVVAATLEEFAQTVQEHFDCIVSVNVLEHIEDDLKAMKQMETLLKPGGHLCLLVPAHPLLYGSLDEAFGHYRRYTKSRLKQLALETGFAVERLRFFNFAGVFTWLLMGKVLQWRTWNRSPVVFYDRLVIPVCRFVERFISLPFGQSLLMVARK